MDTLLEELLSWLVLRESDLLEKESRDLPNTIPETETLIVEHDSFMEETMTREVEVNSVFRAKQLKEKKITKKTRLLFYFLIFDLYMMLTYCCLNLGLIFIFLCDSNLVY